jgi:serine/threonine protein kinase
MSWDRLMAELGTKTRKWVDGYRLLHEIGNGSFGSVYLAERDGVRYAIKFLKEEGRFSELSNFDHLVDLDHPHVVRISGRGVVHYEEGGDSSRGGVNYLVMHHAGDTTLRRQGQPRDEEAACDLFRQILSGVGFLHSRNILHLDLKPGNVILNGGHARIGDYGLAKVMSETLMNITEGNMRGTPLYMAPELAMGDGCLASDVYSLGIMFYELFAGETPFNSHDSAAVLLQHRDKPVKPPPQMPERFHGFLLQSVDKKHQRRFHDANAQLEAFDHAMKLGAGTPVPLPSTTPIPAPRPEAPLPGPAGPPPPGMDRRLGEVATEIREVRRVAQGLASAPGAARSRPVTPSLAAAPIRLASWAVRNLLQAVIFLVLCVGLGLLVHLGLDAALR